MAKSTAVVETTKNAVAAFDSSVPDYIDQSSKRGSEEVGRDDLVLPRLEIIQSQSPIKDTNDDAKEGHFFNSASGELLGDLIYFMPVYFRKEYLVWKDKNKGGGFGGSYDLPDAARVAMNKRVEDGEDPDDWEIVDTPVHYGLMVDPSRPGWHQQIVISMPKSKAKVSRKWNALIELQGGDRFSRVYKITTFKDKNAKNQTFFNFVVQPAGFPPKDLYEVGLQTYSSFKTQNIRADHASVVGEDEFPQNGEDPIQRGQYNRGEV